MNYKLPVCRWTTGYGSYSQNTVEFLSEIYKPCNTMSYLQLPFLFIIGYRVIKLCSNGVDWFQESTQQNPR